MSSKLLILLFVSSFLAMACDDDDKTTTSTGGSTAGTPAGSTGGTPAGSTGGTPAGSTGGTPAGSEGGTPAGSTGGTPAGSTGGTPAGSTGGTPAGSTGGTPAGNPDPATLCQDACNALGDCAVSVCDGYEEDDKQRIIDGCNTTCQGAPGLATLFNQQVTCEDKVAFASGANPDFAAACAGEPQSPCSIACSAVADCAVEACTGYAPEDKAAIAASCETLCTPELATQWEPLSCADKVATFSAASEPFATQCTQAQIACNVCTVYGAAVPAVSGLIVDAAAASPDFGADFAYLASRGPDAISAFKTSLANFVSDAFGCTTGAYTGPDMVAAHTGLGITSAEYDQFVGLIANVMTQAGVSNEYLSTCFAPALTATSFKSQFLAQTFPTCNVNVCTTYGAAVPTVVSGIVDAAAMDPVFATDFAGLVAREQMMPGAVAAFKTSLTNFITDEFGCTTGAYTGPNMVTVHTDMGITRPEYHDFIVRLSVGVLAANGVPEADILGCFAPKLLGDALVNDIVEK